MGWAVYYTLYNNFIVTACNKSRTCLVAEWNEAQ